MLAWLGNEVRSDRVNSELPVPPVNKALELANNDVPVYVTP